MFERHTPDSVSRRSIIERAGAVLTGTTLLSARTGARSEQRYDFEITATTETTITARVTVSAALAAHLREVPSRIGLGHGDRYGRDDVAVERAFEDGAVATPDVMASFERPDADAGADRYGVTMRFRTREIDFSEAEVEDGTLTMGLIVPRPGPQAESVVVTDEIDPSSVGGD